MNLHSKFSTPVFTFVLVLCGVGFTETLHALNNSAAKTLSGTLAAKADVAPAAGFESRDLLCLGAVGIWLLIVAGVGLLVWKEVRKSLDEH